MSFRNFIAGDIFLDQDSDLKIQNGDFSVVPSDKQHIEFIVESAAGNWHFTPTLGADITSFVNTIGTLPTARLKKAIKVQLERDGYRVQSVKILNNGQIEIDANRIK